MRLHPEISRRIRLFKKAISIMDYTNWESVFENALFSSISKRPIIPSLRLLGEENGFGFYQVGEKRIYFPLSFDPNVLKFCYREIFWDKVY